MTQQYTSFRFQIPSDTFTNVPGALLNFYLTNTTTPVTVYSDPGLSIALSNPVQADGFGLFPTIFMAANDYTIVATDANDVELWTNNDFTIETIPVLSPNYFSLISGIYYPAIAVNAQTGTGYNVVDGDRASMVTFNNSAGGTITLPAPSGANFPNKWYAYFNNTSVGDFVLGSTANINGVATFTLSPSTFTLVVSDGTTYYAGAAANFNQIFAKAGGTLTIASGVVTLGAFSEYLIETEGASASDDLDTISGVANGKLLFISALNAAHNVVVKHNTGNIYNPSGQDITLDNTQDIIEMRYSSVLSKWIVVSVSTAFTKQTRTYTSALTAYTDGVPISFSHGFPGKPFGNPTGLLECTSIDGGYAVGDQMVLSSQGSNSSNPGATIYLVDITTIKFSTSTSGYCAVMKDGSGVFTLDPTKWKVIISAVYYG